MKIDRLKFHKFCDAAQKDVDTSSVRTGATRVIESVMPDIKSLRDQGVSWDVIAAALSEQGLCQGADRTPLTGRRLTALVNGIRKRRRRGKKSSTTSPVIHDVGRLPSLLAKDDVDDELAIRQREFRDRVQALIRSDA